MVGSRPFWGGACQSLPDDFSPAIRLFGERSFPVLNRRNMLILAEFCHLAVNSNLPRKETQLNGKEIAQERCTIREAAGSDLVAMARIDEECYPLPWSYQQFVQELENRVATLLVCEIKNRIVGYICYWLIGAEMEILNLATAPEVRRKGVAARLMSEAFSRCSENHLSAAWLEVRATNHAAIALYRRSGFTPSRIRKAYYRDGEDAIIMVKMFDNQELQESF